MKEFALKHPILTFLLADVVLYNAFVTVNNIARIFGKKKEENADEPANDIQ